MKIKSVDSLAAKIRGRKARIAVIGLGYVGLPLAHAFAEQGFPVDGIDRDPAKIRALSKGESYITDLDAASVRKIVKSGRFKPHTGFDSLAQADVVIVCVPTPLNRFKDPDISYIVSAAGEIAKRLSPGKLVVLESTTYPGTTEEVFLPKLEDAGLKVGRDFFLCFSPERIDPANPKYKTKDIPKVVGGVTPACTRLAVSLYGSIISQIVPVSSPRTAEMTKLLENTFRIVNIGLVNELARVAHKFGVDIWEAINAAKTKPFGFMPFYPGPGIGGHCIGIDPIYLSWKARTLGVELDFIDLARRVNAEMPEHVVSQAVYALNRHSGKAASRSKVLVLGVAYKKNVSDMRESPALDILARLHEMGATVSYHDPYVSGLRDPLKLRSQTLTAKLLRAQDLVILATDHSSFDYAMIARHARLIYDTRNAFHGIKHAKVVKL